MKIPKLLEEAITLRQAGKWKESLHILEHLWVLLENDQRTESITCLNEQSHCLWRMGKLDTAETQAKNALQLARQIPVNLKGYAEALDNLGVIYSYRGKFEKAENSFQKSFALFEELGNSEHIAKSLNHLGVTYAMIGKLKRAEKLFRQSYKLFEEVKDYLEMGKCLDNLGIVFRQRGELKQAKECHEQSYTLFKKINRLQAMAYSLNNLGIIYRQSGEFNEAKKSLEQSLNLRESFGHSPNIAESRYQLIGALMMQGALDAAHTHLNLLENQAQTSGIPEIFVKYHLAAGLLGLKNQDLEEALKQGIQAKNQAKIIPHFELHVEAMFLIVQVLLEYYLNTKQPEYRTQITNFLEKLEDLSKRKHLHRAYLETIFIQGLLKQSEFDLEGAVERFRLVELLAEERGIHPIAQRAHLELEYVENHLIKYKQLVFERIEDYKIEHIQKVKSYLKQVKHLTLEVEEQ